MKNVLEPGVISLAVFLLFLPLLSCPASDTDDLTRWKPGLSGGTTVTGSTSPNGRWGLFEIYAYDMGMPMTANAIAVADAKRSTLIGLLNCETHHGTDLPYHAYLTVLWSPDSGYLAIHDSTPKHSLLKLYRVTGSGLKPIDLPDLRQLAATSFHLTEKKIHSSGQMPIKWSAADSLIVQVRLTTDEGVKQKEIALQISPDGLVRVLP